MISTVTTTVSSMASSMVSSLGVGASLGVVAVVSLIGLLIVKELASTESKWSKLSKSLSVAILPLLMIFVGIVAVKIVEVL